MTKKLTTAEVRETLKSIVRLVPEPMTRRQFGGPVRALREPRRGGVYDDNLEIFDVYAEVRPGGVALCWESGTDERGNKWEINLDGQDLLTLAAAAMDAQRHESETVEWSDSMFDSLRRAWMKKNPGMSADTLLNKDGDLLSIICAASARAMAGVNPLKKGRIPTPRKHLVRWEPDGGRFA